MNFFNRCNNCCNCQNNWQNQNSWIFQNICFKYYPHPCWFLECEQNCCCPCTNNIVNPVIITNAITTSLATAQTVTSPNLFDLGAVSSTSGSAITFDAGTNQFMVLSSGTYRVTYSFDYLSGTTGVFGVQFTSLPVTRSNVSATASVSGSVTKSTDVVLTAGQTFGLQLLAPDGTVTLNSITASNLVVSVIKIL